ncbi:MAG: hypothetical protein GY906_38350 [bacterium]|nr:hypothetical protein [bacterium]
MSRRYDDVGLSNLNGRIHGHLNERVRIQPSVGIGLRFMLSEKNRLNLSVDYAVGRDSDALYFYVG